MTLAPHLAQIRFVDLYLGSDYADFTTLPGAHAALHTLPPELQVEADQVRGACAARYSETGDSAFAIDLASDVLCRVTVIFDLRSNPVYVLRKVNGEVMPLQRLGLPRAVHEYLLQPAMRGLVLICGEQGTGKTTTAASALVARLSHLGGRGVAVEDPPENKLDGMHGHGRCLQIPVSNKHGGYADQIRQGMRTGASMLLIGEIRAPDTAREAVQASVNGMTVIATIHGNDIQDGIRRLITWAQSSVDGMNNANDLLSSGLSAVIHQRIERMGQGSEQKARALFRTLLIDNNDPMAASIRTKIAENRLDQLSGDIDQQVQRNKWTAQSAN